MSDDLDFLPLRKVVFQDAGDHGLAMRLETQEHQTIAYSCSDAF